MNRETDLLSTGLDIYNVVLCLVVIIFLIRKARTDKSSMWFIFATLAVMIFNLSDISNWQFEGLTPAWHVPALHICTFIFFAIVPCIFIFFIKYLEEYLKPVKVSQLYIRIVMAVTVFYLMGVCVSPSMGLYYTFNENNEYVRGQYNFVCTIFYVIFFVLCIVFVVQQRKHLSTRFFLSCLSFAIIPICTEIIQIFTYGLALVNTGLTLSVFLIFINAYSQLEKNYEISESSLVKKENELIKFQEHTINSLSNLVENRDVDTGEHAQRTSIFVEMLAQQTRKDGFYTELLDDNYIRLMVKAAPMHDVGKIVVSDTILKKPGTLTKEEFQNMKVHAQAGGRIVENIIGISTDKEYVKISVDMARSHHEWWDGNGYPDKLSGTDIPLCARIMAVADVFDALVFERCYKKSYSIDTALKIMTSESGSHFDPILIKEFLKIRPELERILKTYGK